MEGTTYAELKELSQQFEEDLPPMYNGDDRIRVIPKKLLPVAQEYDPRIPLPSDCQWSNDDLSHTGYDYPDTKCNSNIGDKDPTKYYNYRCLETQNVYHTAYDRSLFDFTLKDLPDVTTLNDPLNPYTYTHRATFCGREMELCNMYISYRLADQLEKTLDDYITDTFSLPMKRNIIGQLIQNTSSRGEGPVKLQMIVKDEYFYWAIFMLSKHSERLRRLGLSRFKFSYLLGERKFNKFSEMFPRLPRDEELFEIYTEDGITYKREVLHAPTIVMYLHNLSNFKPLIDYLKSIFPVPISKGSVPRFNYRIDENLFFSVGGNNADKFDIPGFLPTEYEKMLEYPVKYEDYNRFSRYISGHDVLVGKEPNNIKSYHYLFKDKTSFQEVYKSIGLSEFYDSMWGKLELTPILERPIEGGKRTRRRRKHKRTRKNNLKF